MFLTSLVKGLNCEIIGQLPKNLEIKDIHYDSRKVTKQSLFVCIDGYYVDGHNFAKDAIKRGAIALIVEKKLDIPCVQILVPNCREALAYVSSLFFCKPSEKLELIGVTGTNGKTTITHLIKSILDLKKPSALIGTIGIQIGVGEYLPVNNTTPESLEFQKTLNSMYTSGIKTVVSEVSSHGLEEHRLDYCAFDVAVFSNLSQDHLDFHHNMENYFFSKLKLFKKLKNENSFAVINIDDLYGQRLVKLIDHKIITYGLNSQADVKGHIIEANEMGTKFNVQFGNQEIEISFALAGDFNVSNALSACAVALGMGYDLEIIKKGLEQVNNIPGRLERINLGQNFSIYIDFAHTPDGLEKVLSNLSKIKEKNLISVFGCPGNSDVLKRPIMAKISEKYSDLVIVTSDNPKYECPSSIISDIAEGFRKNNYEKILDREAAVLHALSNANDKDIVLLAGKGHENYQLVNGEKIPYSDKDVVYKFFSSSWKKEVASEKVHG